MKNFLKKIYSNYQRNKEIKGFVKPLVAKYVKLKEHRPLTKEQKKEIREYFKELTGG